MKTLTLAFVFLSFSLFGAIPPPYQPNPWSTNVAGTTVQGGANIAIQSQTVYYNTNELVLTNGQVGIGTNVPSRKVHIRDSLTPLRVERSSPSPIAGHFELYNPDTTDGDGISFDFLTDTTGIGGVAGQGYGTVRSIATTHDHPTRAGDLLMLTLSPAGNTEKVRIKSMGQVGVGTNDPQARLHVIGDGVKTNLLSLGTTATNNLANVDTNGNAFVNRAFRADTNDVFADQEFITEGHLQALLETLEGQTLFLTTNAHTVISGARAAQIGQVTDQWLTNTMAAGSNFIGDFFATNYVSGGVIKAGPYDVHLHAEYSQAGNPLVQVGFHLIRTNGAGTVIVQTGETAVIGTVENGYVLGLNIGTPIVVSSTDFIGVRLYGTRTGGASAELRTHFGGNTDSHFTTPNLESGGGSGVTMSVQSNGVNVVTIATNLNFINATKMTNSSGNVSIDIAPDFFTPVLPNFVSTGQDLFDDMFYMWAGASTTIPAGNLGWLCSIGGSGVAKGLFGETNAPGIVYLESNTTSGSQAAIHTSTASSSAGGPYNFGTMTVTNIWRVRWGPTNVIGDGAKLSWGLTDGVTLPDGVNGAYWQLSTNRPHFICNIANANVVTGVTNTDFFPEPFVWYTLGIVIQPSVPGAVFWLNGAPFMTNSTALPNNEIDKTVGLWAQCSKMAGATRFTNVIDYVYMSYRLSPGR